MDLLNELNEMKENKESLPLANWIETIVVKATKKMLEKSQGVNLFSPLLLEECMQEAHEDFCRDKANGLIDKNNFYVY